MQTKDVLKGTSSWQKTAYLAFPPVGGTVFSFVGHVTVDVKRYVEVSLRTCCTFFVSNGSGGNIRGIAAHRTDDANGFVS